MTRLSIRCHRISDLNGFLLPGGNSYLVKTRAIQQIVYSGCKQILKQCLSSSRGSGSLGGQCFRQSVPSQTSVTEANAADTSVRAGPINPVRRWPDVMRFCRSRSPYSAIAPVPPPDHFPPRQLSGSNSMSRYDHRSSRAAKTFITGTRSRPSISRRNRVA